MGRAMTAKLTARASGPADCGGVELPPPPVIRPWPTCSAAALIGKTRARPLRHRDRDLPRRRLARCTQPAGAPRRDAPASRPMAWQQKTYVAESPCRDCGICFAGYAPADPGTPVLTRGSARRGGRRAHRARAVKQVQGTAGFFLKRLDRRITAASAWIATPTGAALGLAPCGLAGDIDLLKAGLSQVAHQVKGAVPTAAAAGPRGSSPPSTSGRAVRLRRGSGGIRRARPGHPRRT